MRHALRHAMGRSTRRSRYGCKQCKQYHLKCDETKPTCVNCAKRDRGCSYQSQLAQPFPRGGSSGSGSASVSSPSDLGAGTASAASDSTQESCACNDNSILLWAAQPARRTHSYPPDREFAQLLQQEFLEHFSSCMAAQFVSETPESDAHSFVGTAVKQAKEDEALLHQLMALSAAHKSTLQQHNSTRRQLYIDEAARLHTHALSFFNSTRTELHGDNFLFSVFLAHYSLFDTLADWHDFPNFLAKMVTCLRLSRGIRVTASQALEAGSSVGTSPSYTEQALQNDEGKGKSEDFAEAKSRIMLPAKAWDDLGERIHQQVALAPAHREALQEVCRLMQHLWQDNNKVNMSRHASLQRASMVQKWAVLVPEMYTELLHQRRPEALVILAHLAILVLDAKDYWAFQGSGQKIIRGVSLYLGEYWAPWLHWPLIALEQVGP